MSLAKKKNWPWKAYNLEQETKKQINEMEKGKRLRQRLNAYDQRKCRQEEEPLSGPSQQSVWWRAAVTCLLYMKVLVQKKASLTSQGGWYYTVDCCGSSVMYIQAVLHPHSCLRAAGLQATKTVIALPDSPSICSLFYFLCPEGGGHLVQHTFQDLDWGWVIVKKNISG